MNLLERVKILCKENGISQRKLEKDLEISNGASSKWNKSSPSVDLINKLAKYFNVQTDYLTGESVYKTKEEMFQQWDDNTDLEELRKQIEDASKSVTIKVLGEVAAGIPIEAVEDIVDTEEISPEMAITGEFFGLKIKGDSMSPRILEGDTVIVRQQDDAETGDVVIAMVNGDSATCKRLMKYEHGISLLSFNPTYQPMSYTNEQILKLPIKIIGKVVENRQKY